MLVALVLAANLTNATPQILVKPSADGYAAEAADFDAKHGQDVELEVARRAGELCGAKRVDWGKFRFDEELGKGPGAGSAKVKAYRREFRCVDPSQASYVAAPANWSATARDDVDVRRYVQSYYARRDAGDMLAAIAMFRPGVIGDRAGWIDGVRDLNQKLGSGQRRIVQVTWYVNPEGVDRPGVYAAIDFVGDYPNAHFYCGYLGLYRLGPGSYEIVREEQNQFMRNEESPNPVQLAKMRALLCRGN